MRGVQTVANPRVISDLLDQAITYVQNYISTNQDGLIGSSGYRRLGGDAITLSAYDANNHQLTWGVLGAALQAVRDFMSQSGNSFGMVYFAIFDGENQTGEGRIGHGGF